MKAWHIAGVVLLIGVGVPVGCSLMSTATSVATAPGRVVQRTMQTDNIIQNYEMFFDLNAQFEARQGQIGDQQGYLSAETDPVEQRRLRMELAAMKQSCRDLSTKYNAEAAKINRGLFKSNNLPETLQCAD